jgi:hypothetical protein
MVKDERPSLDVTRMHTAQVGERQMYRSPVA